MKNTNEDLARPSGSEQDRKSSGRQDGYENAGEGNDNSGGAGSAGSAVNNSDKAEMEKVD